MINRSSDYLFHGGIDDKKLSNDFDYPDEVLECLNLIYEKAKRDVNLSTRIKTIILDCEEIRQQSESAYKTVLALLHHFPASYSRIAEERNVTRQAIHKTIKRLAEKYDWIDSLRKAMIS